MKKICSIILCVMAVSLIGCQDSVAVRNAVGGYSYKASGVVRVSKSDTVMDVHLSPETGTMSLSSKLSGGEATLSFNHNGGDSYDLEATIAKDSIRISEARRLIDIAVSQDTLLSGMVTKRRETFAITVWGDGKVLSNGDVCLSLRYEGDALNDNYHLSGEEIHVHAKKNEK